jgi:ribose transport system ATP-binding protein
LIGAVDAAPVLEVRGLAKSFHDQLVLDDVDLDVVQGEIHALLGANGSGKSTLIKVVAGFHAADRGTVGVDGRLLGSRSPADMARHGVRFVHQDGGLIAALSVAENILLTDGCPRTRWRTVDRRRQAATVSRLLARWHVHLDPDRPVGTLRAVERSAVSIAKAIAGAGDLRLLVLDEPTAALSATEVEALFALVDEVVRSGASVLYVTHRLDEVLRYADRATVLRDGRLVETRAVAELDESALAGLIVGVEQPVAAQGRAIAVTDAPTPAVGTAGSAPAVALRAVALRSPLLRGVDVTLQRGEVLGIAGLNGSGREDVPAVLVGLLGQFDSLQLPDGRVTRSIAPADAVRHGLVLVPGNRQPGSAVFEFDLQENLGMTSLAAHRRLGLLDVRAERRLVEDWIDRLDIRPPDPRKPFNQLSGGNQQKVILAKWLAVEPAVVVLDEPTAGVDVGARRAIYEIVRRGAAAGISFIVCSSDNQDHAGMTDRTVLLADGAVVGELQGTDITEHALATRLATASAHASASALAREP